SLQAWDRARPADKRAAANADGSGWPRWERAGARRRGPSSFELVPDAEVVAPAAVDAFHQPERAPGEVDRHAALAVDRTQVAFEHASRGHVAQRGAGAAAPRGVGLGAMDHVHVVQRHLAGLELDVDGLTLVECPGGHALVEGEIGTLLVQMLVQPARRMRARNDAQAAVIFRGGLERHPGGAGGEWTDRPVVPVLVPGGFIAFHRGLAEHVAAPEDHVVAE